MVAMHGNGYKLLGYVVWHGGKWYLRRRLPSTRVLATAAAGVTGAAVALLARRTAS
jgi:hypothetical protein